MRCVTDVPERGLDSLGDWKKRWSGVSGTMGRDLGGRCGGFPPGLWFLLLGVSCLVLGGPMPLRAQTPRALRVTGTIQRTEFDQRGIELHPGGPPIAFLAAIVDVGRWSITGESSRGSCLYQQGFDGLNTYLVYGGKDRSWTGDPSSGVTPDAEEWTQAAIFPGNEFPFRAGARSHLEWFVLSSFEYQQHSERVGHVPSLLQSDPADGQTVGFLPHDSSVHGDPLQLALKVRSTFRAEWPRFVEQAEFVLDPRGIPKQPFGLKIPTEAESAKEMDAQWKSLLAQSPGARVGRLTSSEPKSFGGRVLPTRYRLEMTWRFSRADVASSMLDNPMARIDMKIDDVQDLAQGVDRPKLPVAGVSVFDYRFRRVSRDSVMEYLAYSVKDARWRSQDDFGLRFSAALDHLSSPKIVRVENFANSLY